MTPPHLAAAFAWWRGELAGMLPAALRARGPRRVVDLRGEAPMVACRRRGAWQAEAPLEEAAHRLRAEPTLLLAVPEGWVLRRRLRLPEAAEARLAAVLDFELEQHMPFAAAETAWSARIARRLPEEQRIEVEVAILPLRLVAPAAARLRTAGLRAPLVATPDPARPWPALR
ncbi:hypothetical protein, partial [Paracraurococcus ruber]